MSSTKYIKVEIISENYQVTTQWIEELFENDLIQIEESDQGRRIHEEELERLEKMINLNQDLGVNIPGIEVIFNLLARIEQLQAELGTSSIR